MNKAVFQTKLFRLMKQNQDDAKKRKTKSGLIDGSRLAKYKVTNRIFKHRNEAKEGKNYFISILLDASGSMKEDNKYEVCIESAMALCDSLEKIPGMHFEVVGFNALEVKYKDYHQKYNREELYTMYIKQFTMSSYVGVTAQGNMLFRQAESDLKKEDCVSIRHYTGAYEENHDSIAVYNSIKRLRERDGRKILLVFSDGAPTFDDIAHTILEKSTVKEIEGSKRLADVYRNHRTGDLKTIVQESEKEVDILAVGIKTSVVENFYSNNIAVTDIKSLYVETIKSLALLFKKD